MFDQGTDEPYFKCDSCHSICASLDQHGKISRPLPLISPKVLADRCCCVGHRRGALVLQMCGSQMLVVLQIQIAWGAY